MATIAMIPMPGGTVSAQVLDTDHYDALDSALSHVLATKIAYESISQLMDGLPVWRVYSQTFSLLNHVGAPIREHLEVCEGSVEMADSFLASFNTASLVFDAALLQTFQDAEPGSEQFKIRLIELVARSVHCIAVSIDKNATKAHKGDIVAVTNYQEPAEKEDGFDPIVFEPDANMFVHREFSDHKQYPFGAADMAGYWLEDRIFGGVLLFDRGESGKEAKSVWCLSNRADWTRRVWKLLDWQFDAMINFFLHGADPSDPLHDASPAERRSLAAGPGEPSPLRMLKFPFFCDIDNPYRHDDWDALAYHNIYRDLWERYIPLEKPERCVMNTFDYPDQGVMVREIMKMAEEGPKYRATHLGPLPPSDEPLENLSQEARQAGGLEWLHFKFEEISGKPGEEMHEHNGNKEGDASVAPLADADEQHDNAEAGKENGDTTEK